MAKKRQGLRKTTPRVVKALRKFKRERPSRVKNVAQLCRWVSREAKHKVVAGNLWYIVKSYFGEDVKLSDFIKNPSKIKSRTMPKNSDEYKKRLKTLERARAAKKAKAKKGEVKAASPSSNGAAPGTRLDRIEDVNKSLYDEVKSLRKELADVRKELAPFKKFGPITQDLLADQKSAAKQLKELEKVLK